jgi:hypothetical protein
MWWIGMADFGNRKTGKGKIERHPAHSLVRKSIQRQKCEPTHVGCCNIACIGRQISKIHPTAILTCPLKLSDMLWR